MNHTLHPIEKEEVMGYLDGELPVERAALVAAHLEQCADCQALSAELRQVSQRMAAWQVEPSPARLSDRVTATVEKQSRASQSTRPAKTLVERQPERARPLVGRWILGLAGVAACILLIAAISIPNLLRSRIASNRQFVAGTGDFSRNQGELDKRQVTRDELQRAASGQPAGPMIVRTASLTIVTKEFEGARATIERIVRQHQGYIAQLTVTGQAAAAHTLTAALRLPADQLEAALSELKRLGRVEQESQGGEEVTQQYVDLIARLSNARNTEQRLIEVLRERTGKVTDVLAVEQEIARVRGEIERMSAEQKSLENRVSFATVQLQLTEEYKAQIEMAPPSTATRLHNAMVEGYRGVADSAIGLALFLLSYGPSLLFWGLIFFWPARMLWRRLRTINQ